MALTTAIELMDGFSKRTGLRSSSDPRRYLWTDAFAVINFLELHRKTKDERYRALALDLIGQVHEVLGRHRADDPRTSWLSGLPDEQGAAHPTAGGLRIGKPLPERGLDDPPDERLEWERDGQYFHYLTKWMDALSRTASMFGDDSYHRLAAELAKSVFAPFLQTSASGAPVGLAWKMSIDLSRPLVLGMSPHDALDGYVTLKSLEAADGAGPSLGEEVETLGVLSGGRQWGTTDPLGLGGLLLDALRLAILPGRSAEDERMIGQILSGVAHGLRGFIRERILEQPAERRLGFRELGLAIGLQGLDRIEAAAEESRTPAGEVGEYVRGLQSAGAVGDQVTVFWSEHRNRQSPTWQDHQDINDVMLATALLKAQVGTAMFADAQNTPRAPGQP